MFFSVSSLLFIFMNKLLISIREKKNWLKVELICRLLSMKFLYFNFPSDIVLLQHWNMHLKPYQMRIFIS